MTGLLLNGEVKEDATRELPRQQEPLYAASSDNYVKLDSGTGRQYYDLNAANRSYRGAWLYGQEHIQVLVGPLKAQWDQWCPIPADIPDGVLIKGSVVYQQPNGSWNPSADEFEGILRTSGGIRYFVGKTQHTFTGRNVPGGMMKVVANLNVKLTGSASSNPLMPIRRQSTPYQVGGAGGPATYEPYARSQSGAYGSPTPSSYSQSAPAYSQPAGYSQPSYSPPYSQSSGYSQQPTYSPPASGYGGPSQPAYGSANPNPDFLNPSGSSSPQPSGYAPTQQPYQPLRPPSGSNDPDPAGF